jgi:hypothetical protein
LSDQLQRMMKKLEGDGPIEKHIILLKLTEALENAPDFGITPQLNPNSSQRQWLSRVGALLIRLDGIGKKINFNTSMNMLSQYWQHSILKIQGQVLDAIEELKLELELDGRNEIGTAYAPGDVYKFFADLKDVINSATANVLIIDPYFNGAAFDAYLASVSPEIQVFVLADKYSSDISAYIEKHKAQFASQIQLRRSNELHDRIIFVDNDSAWIMGGSIKDAGKKATYLIPLQSELSQAKRQIYDEIWGRASDQQVPT